MALVIAAAGPAVEGSTVMPAAMANTSGTVAGTIAGVGIAEPDGALFTPGSTYPSLGALNAPVVGWAPSAAGGAWEVASDGGIFARGTPFFGSMGGVRLNQPVVGMASTPDGGGYWLVASDGGIFTFGDARFYGSTGGMRLNRPVVGMASTPDGGGYWLVASDGGIFTFGDARFYGSTGSIRLNQPILGMASTPDGGGYWLVASDGGIFTFGDAGFFGSATGRGSAPTVSIASTGDGGYAAAQADGSIWEFGPGQPGSEVLQLPVPSVYVAAIRARQIAQTAVSVALAQVGKPYAVGGTGPSSFDCSGLTQFSYGAAGLALPRTAAAQFVAVPHVSLAAAQPGDLLFFYPGITHVGIFLGNGLMVDAATVGTLIRVESFAWFGPVMGVGRPA